MQGSLLIQTFIYLSAAVLAVPLAKRLGLGSVLGYLMAGVIIGPYGLQLIGEEGQDVMHFAEFGVVMMLFLVGLELQPSVLWKLRVPILGMGGLQVALTALVVLGVGLLGGFSWQVALAIGLILAMSSTAIVLQVLNEKGVMKTDAGQRAFSVLLFQDIAVIPILVLLPLLATLPAVTAEGVHSTSLIEDLPAWAQAICTILAVGDVVLTGMYLVRPLFRFIASSKLREIFTAAALALVVGITVLMSLVGLSPALGTFIAGVVLAGSEYRHELEGDIEPFKGLLLGLFFIAVGASINFGLIYDSPGMIALLVVGLFLLKLGVLLLVGRLFKLNVYHTFLFSFALAQGGEFAFVLFSFAIQHGVLSPDVANPMVAVVALSMAATPIQMILYEKFIGSKLASPTETQRSSDVVDEENSVIIAGFGRFGNVVGRFLRANGLQTTFLDLDGDNVEVLRKLGIKVFYGDASRLDLLHAAGAAKAKLIILAINDPKKTVELVGVIKEHFPNLEIMSRAFGRSDAYSLIDRGVKHVYRETFDASLRLGVDALKLLGFRAYQVQKASQLFRKHDERDLKDLAMMRGDKKSYLSEARQRIEDLERIMKSEEESSLKTVDQEWDTASLREDARQWTEKKTDQG